MDAPQFPDAEASAEPAGEQPAGQVSAFRRALDSQVESTEPSTALVPMDPHDHTAPINVAILRTLLASGKAVTADGSPSPDETPTVIAQIPVFPEPAELPIPTLPISTTPVPAMPPSASGPTVVMPSVSAPALHAPTTIAETPGPMPADTYPPNAVASNAAAAAATTRKSARAAATFAGVPVMMNPAEVSAPSSAGSDGSRGDGGDGPPTQEPSPRHNAKPSRLPTAVWISALLGACAAVALVLVNAGHSPGPLPLSALPTKAATHSPSPSPSPSLKPSPKPSPSPSPKPSPKPSPSHSPSPSPSPSKPPASPTPSAVASFATIYWTNSPDPRVQDIQQRLTRLNYMFLFDNVAYADTSRTTGQSGWHTHADPVGMYQNATQMAIIAFKYDYLQHDQGPQPDSGCDVATYQALVNATS